MSQKNNEYYPKYKPFTELYITFLGDRINPVDTMCYLKLKSISRKLNMTYPEFIVNYKFFSYGSSLRYGCRTILEDNTEEIEEYNGESFEGAG